MYLYLSYLIADRVQLPHRDYTESLQSKCSQGSPLIYSDDVMGLVFIILTIQTEVDPSQNFSCHRKLLSKLCTLRSVGISTNA